MFEITRYESERRVRGTVVLVVLLALYVALVLAIAPDLIAQYAELAGSLPETFQKLFGVSGMSTLAGFLSVEFYQFGWLVVLGLFFAYSAGSLVAHDVETDHMDTLLSAPISRSKIVVEKFLSLLMPILAVNIAVGIVVYAGTTLIAVDESLTLADIVAVHALSIPYLLCCAGIGLCLSVLVSREHTAQRAALGVVFGLYMLESLVIDTDYEWLGALSPTRYYEPTTILVENTYDLAGAVILLAAAIVLVAASQFWFRRTDIQ
ncbi:MAG TPA: ABC transporter permease subunit [Halococcus sp.]|nr:ABC transporter permease subunit [Halococcus sp.]